MMYSIIHTFVLMIMFTLTIMIFVFYKEKKYILARNAGIAFAIMCGIQIFIKSLDVLL